MDSRRASEQMRERIWPEFSARFKSSTTEGSYMSDLCEIMELLGKDFLQITKEDTAVYFQEMKAKVDRGELSPATVAKKFRELHSMADFICENRERYRVPDVFQDHFRGYLGHMAGQERYAKCVSAEEADRLLEAAKHDSTAYTIFVLLYRMGLSSTQICALRPEDITVYENGPYLHAKGRRRALYIPEDVLEILERYLSKRQEGEYLFVNRRGRGLNLMYVSRLMKKYTALAGLPPFSAEMLRNACAFTLFSYGADEGQVAEWMGTTRTHILRYKNIRYREEITRQAGSLVRLRVEPPGEAPGTKTSC